ncbi:MAG: hypothetical protein ACP5O0_01020 [Acidimicrobiales bacterium]
MSVAPVAKWRVMEDSLTALRRLMIMWSSRTRRWALRGGLVGVGSLALAACSISPYAVIINGQRISVASLNAELNQITSNKSFVAQV